MDLVLPHGFGAGVVALVAAGDQAEPPVSFVRVGQLPRCDGQAVVHLPIFVDVIQNQEILGIMQISGLFTCIALLRKYTIRRWFEKMRFWE